MIAWMAYAALIGALIAAGAFAVERLVASRGRPRRFVWLGGVGVGGGGSGAGGLGPARAPAGPR
ncbi:MAG: hypothetical protein OXG35_26345, partial [Acidobacteria bacterium]|nr:hypothetical protein [Acidobacteriota bacterium]